MKKILLVLCSLALSGCVSSHALLGKERAQAHAQEDAWAAAQHDYQQGEIARTVEQLKPLAKQGYAKAQYALGYFYYYGQGVPVNRKKALVLFRKAADQNEPHAIEALQRLRKTQLFSTD